MKIILLKDYKGLGDRGQIVEVSNGFAKNKLIPAKIADEVSPQLIKQIQKEATEKALKLVREKERIESFRSALKDKVFSLEVATSKTGQLYGGIMLSELLDKVNKFLHSDFNKHDLVIPHSIKHIGNYQVELKLSGGTRIQFYIQLIPNK